MTKGNLKLRVGAGAMALSLVIGISAQASSASQSVGSARPHKSLTTITLGISKAIYSYLPVWIAYDKGYFQDAGINIVLMPYTGSSVTQIPMVADGAEDVTVSATVPGIYNAITSGLNVKLVASFDESKPGYSIGTEILIRTPLYNQGIHSVAQLAGSSAKVDLGNQYSPNWLVFVADAQAAHVSLSSLHTDNDILLTAAQDLAAMQSGSEDVIVASQPTAQELIADGVAKVIGSDTNIPWYQNGGFVANGSFYNHHLTAMKEFLEAYLRGVKLIDKAGKHWTQYIINEIATWSGIPASDVAQIPQIPYFGQLGSMNKNSLAKQQQIFLEYGGITNNEKISVTQLYDVRALTSARQALGIKGPSVTG